MKAAAAGLDGFGPGHTDWGDWRAQLRERVRTVDGLVARLPGLAARRAELERVHGVFPLSVTPYYLSLADPEDPACPILAQAVGDIAELTAAAGTLDPLAEEAHRPGKVFLHRYPDRLLVYTGTHCGVICRHCTRKRLIGIEPLPFGEAELDSVVAYIQAHPEIHEVILSGGDPFMLADGRLLEVVGRLLALPQLDLVRLHTRVPVTLPMRIGSELARALGRLGPVWCVTHFNHPRELTAEATEALANLVSGGVPVLNQAVLLKGVNDRFETQRELNRGLLRRRVKPYYLHHGDPQAGAMHFRTSIDEGLELMKQWRGHSGLLQPVYCVDGDLGKIPMLPAQAKRREEGWFVAENFEGRGGLLE